MKKIRLIMISLLYTGIIIAQQNKIVPDLSKVKDSTKWNLVDREIISSDHAHLSAGSGDGVLWLKALSFKNGTIELDIKGKDKRGESFVGLAFHGLDKNNFDVIYFRPFNFRNAEKKDKSVQYVSLPEFTWQKLRKEHPGVYENEPKPAPDPNEWFHAKVIVDYPTVKIYINNSDEPSLTVEQLSTRKSGWIGLWVGNNSEGEFKNLKITKREK